MSIVERILCYIDFQLHRSNSEAQQHSSHRPTLQKRRRLTMPCHANVYYWLSFYATFLSCYMIAPAMKQSESLFVWKIDFIVILLLSINAFFLSLSLTRTTNRAQLSTTLWLSEQKYYKNYFFPLQPSRMRQPTLVLVCMWAFHFLVCLWGYFTRREWFLCAAPMALQRVIQFFLEFVPTSGSGSSTSVSYAQDAL